MGATQSESLEQVGEAAVAGPADVGRAALGRAAHHALGAAALHCMERVRVFPVQLAALHSVAEGYFWQAPAPSQEPFWPQVAAV